MDIAEIVLQYLEVILSWPTVGLTVGLVAIQVFKEPFSDFLRRVVKGQAYGVRVEATKPKSQLQEAEEVEEGEETIAESPQGETEVRDYVRENPGEAVEELFRYYNGYRFERYYNIIYGTQISLLEHLADKGDDGEMYVNVRPWYLEHLRKADYSEKEIQMADYLKFLENSGLIKTETEDEELRLKITSDGVNFLSYIKSEYPSDHLAKSF